MKKLAYLLCGVCCLLLASCATSPENIRERVDFGEGWRFQLGIGWYRKTFVPEKADAGKQFRIVFDGVYMNSEVFLNGVSLGHRPYGYITFSYDLTPHLKWGEENVIAVRVDNSEQPNSRWYSGCGIYRNVWLVKTGAVHVAEWGTYVVSDNVSDAQADLKIQTRVANESDASVQVKVRSSLLDAEGQIVASGETECSVEAGKESETSQTLQVEQPELWSVDTPYIYTLLTEVVQDGKTVDRYETPVGIRSFSFDAEKGFTLNEKPMKINGVCMHHDLGCLGAAVNVRAIERQLEILKEMGCNGIRCSHNPPAPELLDLCDRMGFIVMDESFDMWRKKKTSHDYARYFDEWYERDLRDFILRDRNHPSIFIWSIGNEVLEQWSDAKADTLSLEEANLILNFGHSADMLAKEGEMSVNSLLAKRLAGLVKELDPTRPITTGCNEPNPANHLFKSGAMDIIGYNYHNANIPDVPRNFPGKPFIITRNPQADSGQCLYQRAIRMDGIRLHRRAYSLRMARAEFVFRYRRPCRIPEGRLLPLSGGMVGQARVASLPALELDTGAGRGYVVLL